MLTLGSEDHRGDESRRKEWLAPALSVLVFRATANGVTSTTDDVLPGFYGSSPPPPAAPPPPPPPAPAPAPPAAIATAAAAVERRPSMRWSRAGGRRNRHDFLYHSHTDV